jgi:hypothetical protein
MACWSQIYRHWCPISRLVGDNLRTFHTAEKVVVSPLPPIGDRPCRPRSKGVDDVSTCIIVLICVTTDDEHSALLVALTTNTVSSAYHCNRQRKKDDKGGDVSAHFLGWLPKEEYHRFIMASCHCIFYNDRVCGPPLLFLLTGKTSFWCANTEWALCCRCRLRSRGGGRIKARPQPLGE